jgi:hypothetical protein
MRPNSNVLDSPQDHSSDTPPTSPSKHLAVQYASKADQESAGKSSSEDNVAVDAGKKQSDKVKGKAKKRRSSVSRLIIDPHYTG